jgi:competence protein ComEC
MQVDSLIIAAKISENSETRKIIENARAKKVGVREVFTGNCIPVDQESRVYILYPDNNRSTEKNLNNSSIVVKILYGSNSALFVGDAEFGTEKQLILKYGKFLGSDILKTGHHGSITSSGEEFLQYVHPQISIISVGNHNKFRHPSLYTINRFLAHSIKIDRTDKSGAVIWKSDGKKWTKAIWRR